MAKASTMPTWRNVMLAIASIAAARSRANAQPARVDFSRHVRPILANHCFPCHGPDAKQRKGELRLDTRSELFADRGDYRIVAPGDPRASELVRRITTGDPQERMPPPKSGMKLSTDDIGVIERWIQEGAVWNEHWSLVAPHRRPQPNAGSAERPRNGIDAWVLSRLNQAGLSPEAEAPRETLLRRVTLDLTGLPPTIGELDAFLADRSPDAYERLVDRLLSSPRFGERMAVPWLDAARYADTSGYQTDGPREMWRWRDWVLAALNANMPFDQFTIEQLAGDMLPAASLEQRIATGFNRNHRGNSEGGIIPEEYQVEYVADRVETTSTVWLGLTIGCSRCHDHKYDPFSQREFYRLFAFFNNIPEHGRAIKEGNSPPYIVAPTLMQQLELQRLEAELDAAKRRWERLRPALTSAQLEWEQSARASFAEHRRTELVHWSPDAGLIGHFPLDGSIGKAAVLPASVDRPANRQLTFTSGVLGQAAVLDGSGSLAVGDFGKFGYTDKFSLAAWMHPADATRGTILSRMIDEEQGEGYSLQLADGRLQVNLVKRWLDDAIRVETDSPIATSRWQHVAIAIDGSRRASGVTIYLDGSPAKTRILLDALNQTFATTEPFRIGGGGGPDGNFRGAIDDVRIYNRPISADEAAWLATPESISALVALGAADRTARQSGKLTAWFIRFHATANIRAVFDAVGEHQSRLAAFREKLPTVMVMEEMSPPRPTYLLKRGDYDKPGERVTAGVPSALPPLEKSSPSRLDLARWLVEPSNPLTARVAVNRYWQIFFGYGLVRSAEDFGTQGEPPTHPELLDWLALEFMQSGWDVKQCIRAIVTSATYRQSSRMTGKSAMRDPENRLLARGPRFRLPAETVRDQALAASGLLVEQIGGPSVKPYQPDGLWKEIATDTEYQQDNGPGLFRRSLYTFWKRTVAPPTMASFDAATREMCTVRPTRTNTPLQALALMNDVTFWESSCALASRTLTDAGSDRAPESLVKSAFLRVLARRPTGRELSILTAAYRRNRDRYRSNDAATRRLLGQGMWRPPANLETSELAACAALCSLILNLDEAVTRE